MIKYIKIVKYTAGCSIKEQIQDIINDGQMDKDTRLFFSNNNCLTMKDIAELMTWFDLRTDSDFSYDNVVLVPREYILSVAKKQEKIVSNISLLYIKESRDTFMVFFFLYTIHYPFL